MPSGDPEAVKQRMRAVSALLRRHRYVYASEDELQQQLAGVLTSAGLRPVREVRLTEHDRIDLMVGDVGIEVKVKGARQRPLRQLDRYAEHPSVQGLLLVTTRATTLPETMRGKPVAVVSLLANGLA